MDIITKQEAQLMGLKRYYTGKPCKRGHDSERAITGHCILCKRLSSNRYTSNNKEKIKQYYIKNYNNIKEVSKEYYKKNKKRIEERKTEWKSRNKNRLKQYKLNYKAKHPEKEALRKHEYLSRRTEATPLWYEAEQINQLYRKRNELSVLWGITLHVDHIVPLQGKSVCGLHCWANLQLLEAGINHSKNNHFIS